MKRAIWKYELTPGKTVLHMPKGTVVLCVGTQPNDSDPEMKTARDADQRVFLWAMVDADPNVEDERRVFYAFATGEQFEHNATDKYIGTIQMTNPFVSVLVFHIFETT